MCFLLTACAIRAICAVRFTASASTTVNVPPGCAAVASACAPDTVGGVLAPSNRPGAFAARLIARCIRKSMILNPEALILLSPPRLRPFCKSFFSRSNPFSSGTGDQCLPLGTDNLSFL